MTKFEPHLLTITETVHTEDGESFVEREFDVTCPGVTDHCRAFVDCLAVPAERAVLNFGDPPVAHGVRHQYIDGTWMAATDGCLYAGGDIAEAAEYLADQYKLGPGIYDVDVDYRGDGELDLVYLGEAAVAR